MNSPDYKGKMLKKASKKGQTERKMAEDVHF